MGKFIELSGALMSLEIWLLFVITETVLCLTPGPAVLYVVATAVQRGVPPALAATTGILAANTLYFLISATSLGALITASYDLFLAVKWVGAAYLFYLGIRMFIAGNALQAANRAEGAPGSARRILLGAFVVQMANPKSILFFTALLPQFIEPARPIATQLLILWMTSLAIEFLVMLGYSTVTNRAGSLLRTPRYTRWIGRIAGALLASAGVMMAAIRRG
jgi:homoserine/homoserine lactone efflux protein